VKHETDIEFTGTGSIRRCTPLTERERRWISDNIEVRPECWHEGSWLMEASSEELFVMLMLEDDLNVRRER
jgi:hypothetical protein